LKDVSRIEDVALNNIAKKLFHKQVLRGDFDINHWFPRRNLLFQSIFQVLSLNFNIFNGCLQDTNFLGLIASSLKQRVIYPKKSIV